VESKACRLCGEVLPLGLFHRANGMRDGHRNECRGCTRDLKRANYLANRERYIAAAKAWQDANPERTRETRRLRNQHPERKRKQRDAYFRRTYNISADEFDLMLDAQGGGCALCGVRPKRLASLHVDHDHETGAVRGLLCIGCNQGLGQFRDDPELLRAAAEYVERHRGGWDPNSR
jgi:hypothetical protein